MILDRKFVLQCAAKYKRYLTPELTDQIITLYGTDPFVASLDERSLEQLVCFHCNDYARNTFLPLLEQRPAQTLRERYADLIDRTLDLLIDIEQLEAETRRYRDLLANLPLELVTRSPKLTYPKEDDQA